jgi:hypothetical protein
MNYRIASNRAIFQEELAKLKAQQHDSKHPPLSLPKLPIEVAPSLNLKKRKKESIRAESDRFLSGPSVFY